MRHSMSRKFVVALSFVAGIASTQAHAQSKKVSSPTCSEQEEKIAALIAENAELRAKIGEPSDNLQPAHVPDEPVPMPTGEDGFGGLKWGASTKDLRKKVPKAKQGSNESMWMVEQRLTGRDAMVGYAFVDDMFAVALVFFTVEYVNNNKYLDDHDEVRDLLTAKYGTPTLSSRDYWSDDLYRDDPDNWGMAVATGRLTRISTWETPTTEIELVTKGENFKLSNRIRYGSKKLEKRFDEQAQKRKTDGL